MTSVAHVGVAGPARLAVLVAGGEPEGLVELLFHEPSTRVVERLRQRHPVGIRLDVRLSAPDLEAQHLGPTEDVADAQGDFADERGKVAGLEVHGSPLPKNSRTLVCLWNSRGP